MSGSVCRRASWTSLDPTCHAHRSVIARWGHWHILIAKLLRILVMLECPNTGSDGILQHRGLEQCRPIWYSSDSFICFKDLPSHLDIHPHAVLCVHSQPSQHNRDQASCSHATDKIDVIAWFRHLMWFWRLAIMALGVNLVHEVVEEDAHGVATDSAAICRELALLDVCLDPMYLATIFATVCPSWYLCVLG